MENRCKFLVIPLCSLRSYVVSLTSKSAMILLLLLITSLIGTGNLAAAQQVTVNGTVIDGQGQPVIGATVLVKGTTVGTLSDVNGKYSIPNVAPDATLTFSFVGMTPQEVVIGGRSTVNVTLAEAAIGLNEIIVVGYGTQTKKTLTGAVSSVQADALTQSKSVTTAGALVGKVSGITARLQDARPGAATNLQIRNFGTPLYVIDGVPRTAADFNNLEITNIESISLLKDASAAIYGLQASNGVVLITTKMGKINEKPTINVDAYYGLQSFTRYPMHSNAGTYTLALDQSAQNQGQVPTITAPILAKWKAGTYNPSSDPAQYEDYRSYNYFEEIIGKNAPAPQAYINASASGATERANYFFSVSNLKQNAVIESFWFNRTSIQSNLEAKLLKGLKVGTQISARFEMRHQAGIPGVDDYPNIFTSTMRNWPTERPYANDNPDYVNNTHLININPATYKESFTGWTNESYRVLTTNIYGEYDFGFGLKAKATYGYGYNLYLMECFEYTYPAYTYDRVTQTYNQVVGGGNLNPYRRTDRRGIEDKYAQMQLNYNKKFGKHTIAATAAYDQAYNDNQFLQLHTIPPTNAIPLQNLENEDALTNTWAQTARASYIGRLNYNFNEKYLFEMLGRFDGSYMYAKGSRWGFFPGISAGWRIANEPFFESLKSVVNDFKLRASWGQTGTESGPWGPLVNNVPSTIPIPFGYMGGFNWNSGNYIYNGTTIQGIIPRGIPVTNLSWVTNTSSNIGFDFSLFNDKISGQVDVFQRTRTGIPAARYDVLIPSEVGYTLPYENLNSNANKGVEGMVTYKGKAGPVGFQVGVNGTLSRQWNIQTYKPRFGNSYDEYRNSSEQRWDQINWAYHIIGQFQTMQQIADYPVNIDGSGNRTLLPGDLIYEDLNGDHIINAMDQKPIGYAQGANPYMSFGLTSQFDFKGFGVVLDFSGGTMQTWVRNNDLKIPLFNSGAGPQFMISDVWHQADPFDNTSAWVAGTYPAIRANLGTHSNWSRTNDFYMTSISYMRLASTEISYTLPSSLLSKVGVSKLRIYTNISNLFSIDNVKKFETDPEINASGGLVYPQSRVYNFGFVITL